MKNLKLTMMLLGVSLFFTSNLFAQWKFIRGEGEVIKKEISIENFDAIALSISANVYLTQGSTQKVVVEGQANIIDNIERKVKKGSWQIGYEKSVKNSKRVNIYITMPDLTNILLAGSGDISTQNVFKGLGDLSILVAGSGDVSIEGEAKNVEVSVAGSGDVKMDGTALSLEVNIAGSGDVDLKSVEVENAEVNIAGSGNCKVNVNGRLDVSIIGSGDVYYTGAPKVESSLAGSGSVHRM